MALSKPKRKIGGKKKREKKKTKVQKRPIK
jgi:hypothetical protein